MSRHNAPQFKIRMRSPHVGSIVQFVTKILCVLINPKINLEYRGHVQYSSTDPIKRVIDTLQTGRLIRRINFVNWISRRAKKICRGNKNCKFNLQSKNTLNLRLFDRRLYLGLFIFPEENAFGQFGAEIKRGDWWCFSTGEIHTVWLMQSLRYRRGAIYQSWKFIEYKI